MLSHDYPNLESFLSTELERRKSRNSRYSLRKFAIDLDVEPSFLSKILSGKRRVTPTTIDRIRKKLKLSAEDVRHFKLRLLTESELKRPKKNLVRKARLKPLEFNSTQSVNSAIDFVILELVAINNLNLNTKKISHLVDLPESETITRLENLLKLNLIHEDEDGFLRSVDRNYSIPQNPFSTEDLKNIQRQFLIKSMDNLLTTPLDLRDHSGITMAISSEKLSQAKKMLKDFRRKFMSTLQDGGPYDRVYQLSLSFFPVSKSFQAKDK